MIVVVSCWVFEFRVQAAVRGCQASLYVDFYMCTIHTRRFERNWLIYEVRIMKGIVCCVCVTWVIIKGYLWLFECMLSLVCRSGTEFDKSKYVMIREWVVKCWSMVVMYVLSVYYETWVCLGVQWWIRIMSLDCVNVWKIY